MSAVATGRVTEVTHPLVQHKLSYLRDKATPTVHFRKLVNEVTLLLTYEATKDFPTEPAEIETPLEPMRAQRISGKKVAICPILRAGIGMLDGVLSLVPGARVGFIGLYRNEETLQPVEYYVKLPNDIAERDVILLDPMLATGNSTTAAVETVKRAGAASVRGRIRVRKPNEPKNASNLNQLENKTPRRYGARATLRRGRLGTMRWVAQKRRARRSRACIPASRSQPLTIARRKPPGGMEWALGGLSS